MRCCFSWDCPSSILSDNLLRKNCLDRVMMILILVMMNLGAITNNQKTNDKANSGSISALHPQRNTLLIESLLHNQTINGDQYHNTLKRLHAAIKAKRLRMLPSKVICFPSMNDHILILAHSASWSSFGNEFSLQNTLYGIRGMGRRCRIAKRELSMYSPPLAMPQRAIQNRYAEPPEQQREKEKSRKEDIKEVAKRKKERKEKKASDRSPFFPIKPISQRLIGCRRAGACDNATFTLQGRPLIPPLSAPGQWSSSHPTPFGAPAEYRW
ncbi:hypothetical protein CEXT_194521 [Caerostris extrusa]|uniref:Uncharacterized protein n=1 Tax=Caerostris extrusa TaxID=172846 RepID=A0AAV4ML00_CAEEX|nr:hypothetical protein CEXT_194521 [Caerostris extrusa]